MLHALPDDGNTYELVRGELFVTPAPSTGHESIIGRLNAILVPYVAAQRLGHVYGPRSVVRFEGSEAEPDLMVRASLSPGMSWDHAPVPILVIEVASPTTHTRDLKEKRSLYLDAGVAEYWIVDGDARTLTVVRPGAPDVAERDVVRWHPAGASEPLLVPLADVFGGG
jgi:Uma2 family endonuclease